MVGDRCKCPSSSAGWVEVMKVGIEGGWAMDRIVGKLQRDN